MPLFRIRLVQQLIPSVLSVLNDGSCTGQQDLSYSAWSHQIQITAQKDGYIKFKQAIISKNAGLFPKAKSKNKDVPNLFINGKFYSEIELKTDDKGFEFEANGIMSRKIIPVFKDILGLTDENIEKFTFDLILPFLPELYLKIILQNV